MKHPDRQALKRPETMRNNRDGRQLIRKANRPTTMPPMFFEGQLASLRLLDATRLARKKLPPSEQLKPAPIAIATLDGEPTTRGWILGNRLNGKYVRTVVLSLLSKDAQLWVGELYSLSGSYKNDQLQAIAPPVNLHEMTDRIVGDGITAVLNPEDPYLSVHDVLNWPDMIAATLRRAGVETP